jgi:hypothetical protein
MSGSKEGSLQRGVRAEVTLGRESSDALRALMSGSKEHTQLIWTLGVQEFCPVWFG